MITTLTTIFHQTSPGADRTGAELRDMPAVKDSRYRLLPEISAGSGGTLFRAVWIAVRLAPVLKGPLSPRPKPASNFGQENSTGIGTGYPIFALSGVEIAGKARINFRVTGSRPPQGNAGTLRESREPQDEASYRPNSVASADKLATTQNFNSGSTEARPAVDPFMRHQQVICDAPIEITSVAAGWECVPPVAHPFSQSCMVSDEMSGPRF